MREPSRERGFERGFTIVELMIVVAIIAVLAAIVVPMWTRETRKGKGKSEVTAMLSEIAAKQAQYKAEANAFLTIAKCPSSVSSSSYDFLTACKTGGTGWDDIRIQPTSSKLYCSYEVVADIPGSTLTPPPSFVSVVPATSQGAMATSWFYIHAECDQDGQGGTNTEYYRSSVDNELFTVNEGK